MKNITFFLLTMLVSLPLFGQERLNVISSWAQSLEPTVLRFEDYFDGPMKETAALYSIFPGTGVDYNWPPTEDPRWKKIRKMGIDFVSSVGWKVSYLLVQDVVQDLPENVKKQYRPACVSTIEYLKNYGDAGFLRKEITRLESSEKDFANRNWKNEGDSYSKFHAFCFRRIHNDGFSPAKMQNILEVILKDLQ